MNQAGNKTENRAARNRETELMSDVIRVGALAFPVSRAERLGQLGADSGIPAFVDAVQYAGELPGVGTAAKQNLKSATQFRRGDLPGVGLADGGQVGRVDD